MTLAVTIVRQVVSADTALPLPPGDTSVTRPPWRSRWEFERGGRVWRVSVRACAVAGYLGDPIDAREWIESLGNEERWPEGTSFAVVVEEVRDAVDE